MATKPGPWQGKKSPCLNSSRGVVAGAVGADHDDGDDREEYCLQSGMGGENEVVRGTKAHPRKAHIHMTSPFPSFLARNIKLPSRQQGFLSLHNIGHLCLSPPAHDGVFLSFSNRAGILLQCCKLSIANAKKFTVVSHLRGPFSSSLATSFAIPFLNFLRPRDPPEGARGPSLPPSFFMLKVEGAVFLP